MHCAKTGLLLVTLAASVAVGADDDVKYVIPPEAKPREMVVRIGERFSKAIEYIVDDRCVGRREYYSNGNLCREVAYKNGKQHGIERTWFDNGLPEFESPYKRGSMHGTFRQWNRMGKLLGSYEMNMGTGVKKEWHENGQLHEISPYTEGKEDGFFKRFFADGKPYQVLNFKNGKAHGVTWIWDRTGNLIEGSPLFYVEGKRVTKADYEKARRKDSSLPKPDDNGQIK
jgi:antitoxin component YwqK of YwqJK toxin-antitoxin module